ncbi:MAG: heparinase II/III family protein [Clostridia bacterium]|nr:heparinase II/III family protein [Clostridia bacterium]
MIHEVIQDAIERGAFLSRDAFRPFPTAEDRDAWNKLSPRAQAFLEGMKPWLLACSPMPISASMLRRFYEDGDRSEHGEAYFSRRKNLYALCLCECAEDKGRFIGSIVDHIWAICEETCWVIPAHLHQNPFGAQVDVPLPEIAHSCDYIDLFAAETASVLSWVKYLLGARLNEKYPEIVRRVDYELKRRILDALPLISQMHWSGFVPGKHLNNWTPWICSNLLAVALLEEDDQKKREAWFTVLAKALDKFLDTYSPDGGCDEGPSYFSHAGASLLDALELYYAASGKTASVWHEPLIRSMARYIAHAHIEGEYYINFADGGCRVKADAMQLKRCARFMGDEELEAHAQYLLHSGLGALPYQVNYDGIYRRLRNLMDDASCADAPGRPLRESAHFFDGIQVFSARQTQDGSGLYLAAKGGHNEESHNHNDIGNYIIYASGEPFVVDAGVGVYSRQTFSGERYAIWTMQSAYHNTAILGGLDQKPGRCYAAADVSAENDAQKAVFRLDMARAYDLSENAHYRRTLTLDRRKPAIELLDEAAFSQETEIALPLLCAVKPVCHDDSVLLKGASTALKIGYDAALLSVQTEEIPLKDNNLLANWQRPCLYRLLFRQKTPLKRAVVRLCFTEQKD